MQIRTFTISSSSCKGVAYRPGGLVNLSLAPLPRTNRQHSDIKCGGILFGGSTTGLKSYSCTVVLHTWK